MIAMADANNQWHWSEDDSQAFLDYGRFFVPDREYQIQTICDLIPPRDQPFTVVELASGEGLLAEAILHRFAHATVIGLDGSDEMLQRSAARLQHFGSRFKAQQFELAATDWRSTIRSVHAVVSSLTIHHLDGAGKLALFRAVYAMLNAGGVFVIADVIQPTHQYSRAVAAQAWDDAVRQRSLELSGDLKPFDHFQQARWNLYRYPDPGDMPSPLVDQLQWLQQAGFVKVDVVWLRAGHAIYGGAKPRTIDDGRQTT